ncbi:hypothetical protein SAMN05421739_106193 [Pontibacter chinhatensis]|uniref:MalT-like TPR region domain-containing protein n=1 Tax=Pontibacter chinhatensis TaxID=1436961 RepID=A0A1I2XQZ9_9BACT|nr:hypothetical protein SAMN05421739_106193 [Pontibacter chinhatensis]
MKELQRLIRIIDENTPATSPLINLQENNTLESKLFYLLKNNTAYSDEAVAKEIYGSEKLTGTYRTLKYRFRKKLYNHLYFLYQSADNVKSGNEATYVCLSLLTQAQALMLHSEVKLAVKLLEQVAQIAAEHDNTEMHIRALEGIKAIYQDLGKRKELAKCNKDLMDLYRIQGQEREAIFLYDDTMLVLKGYTAEKSQTLDMFPAALARLWELWEKSGSSKVFSKWHVLNTAYLEQLGEYSKIADSIAQAEALVEAKKVNTSWYNRKFNSYIIVYALLQSRQYEKGLRLAAENIKLFGKHSANWFAFMENYVLLAMHSKQYELAEELLRDVIEGEHLRKLGDSSIERWELYRRYFAFAVAQEREEQLQDLSTGITTKLLILPNDKVGFNLALLVLDVLEKLAAPHVEDLALHAERVRKYTRKHLKGEKAERPRIFMRLLLLVLTKSSAEARAQGEELLEKLKTTPLPGDAFTEVEIVPYEHLWELALHLLNRREQLL